jgi:hypothetical protein
MVCIPLTGLTLPHFCGFPSQDLDFQCHMSWSFLWSVSEDERWLFVLLMLVELCRLTSINELLYNNTFVVYKYKNNNILFSNTIKEHLSIFQFIYL